MYNSNNEQSIKNPLIIILLIGLMHLLLMWPGILSPDSQGQYLMAIAGVYNDHHPPLMAFVWRYLDKIIPGPGMIFLLNLILLYSSIFYLINSIKSYRCRYLLLLFPLIPQIVLYSSMIWKDIGFTFCFLFVASYLTYLTSNKHKPTWKQTTMLLIVLLYGTAIKFQAQYCAPVLLGWMAYIWSNYKIYCKKFCTICGVLFVAFYLSLNSINWILIPNVQKSHSWQLVKIYDLAAISLSINQDLFPEFTKNKNFTMQELSKRLNHNPLDRFKYYMVDDLIFGDAILKSGVNQKERNELYFTWLNAVLKHPYAYLKHRSSNMISMLLYHPTFKYINPLLTHNSALYFIINSLIYLTMSNLIPAILCFIYFVFGIYLLNKMRSLNWFAVPLVCFNAIGIIMMLVLFFCSMAGTPRYTYITVCMVHASHVFAYLGFKSFRKQNAKSGTFSEQLICSF